SVSRIGKTPEILSIRRMLAQFPALCRLPPGGAEVYLSDGRSGQERLMKNLALVGSGKIGVAIAELLGGTGDYRLTVFDRDAESLERMPRQNVETRAIEIADARDFARALDGHEVVLSATPFSLTTTVAEAAKRAGAHYLDLTEDVESTRTIRRLADGADTAFVPQCGLAPGFLS